MQNAGVRSLVQARLFGSTSRLLDIGRLIERFGEAGGVSQAARPFEHGPLNSAMIIKHALRRQERSLFDTDRYVATKLVFPFAKTDLAQGGLSIFIDERGFTKQFLKFLGLPAPDEAYARDVRLLGILDGVPSFDPFLIAERAAMEEIDLPAGLMDLSDSDLVQLRRSVAVSLSRIAALALPDGASTTASDRLANAFLNKRDQSLLDPLRLALRMSSEDFKEAIFSWKGILFYQWKLQTINEMFVPLVKSLAALKPMDADYETTRIVREKSRQTVAGLNRSIVALSEELMRYDEAVRKLTDDRDVEALSSFLNDAANVFNRVGEHSSIISHCIDYWNYGLRPLNPALISAERAIDIVNGITAPLPASWREAREFSTAAE